MGKILKKTPTARPVSVFYILEAHDNKGCYVDESRVIVTVRGNCTHRTLFGDGVNFCPPKAHGGNIINIKYMYDSDQSVIVYGFRNSLFKNRFKTSEKFRNKMLSQINER